MNPRLLELAGVGMESPSFYYPLLYAHRRWHAHRERTLVYCTDDARFSTDDLQLIFSHVLQLLAET